MWLATQGEAANTVNVSINVPVNGSAIYAAEQWKQGGDKRRHLCVIVQNSGLMNVGAFQRKIHLHQL